jgi:hypothetical protein
MPITVPPWLKAHKTAAAGGAAGVAGLALYMRERSKTSTSSTDVTGTGAAASSTTPTAGFDSSNLDEYDQLAGSISDNNDAIDSLTTEVDQLKTLTSGTTNGLTPPAAKTPAPTAAQPAPVQQLSQAPLNALVGTFSKYLKWPTVASLTAYGKTVDNNQLAIQAYNVGQLTSLNGLTTPSSAQILATAESLFPDYSKLNTTSQNIATETANVDLLTKLNPTKVNG